MRRSRPQERRSETFRPDSRNPLAAGLLSTVLLYAGHSNRRVLLQFRSQSGVRMGCHGGRISRRGARRQGRDSRDRIAHTPLLYRNPISAAAFLQTRKAASAGACVRTSRRRLGKKKTGRQRAGVSARNPCSGERLLRPRIGKRTTSVVTQNNKILSGFSL